MLESPPISPKTVRNGKRSRQSSKSEVSIRELSQEDIGYDGDNEVVRPDEVEEPESDFEQEDTNLGLSKLLWPDTDEELAVRMKRLGWKSKVKHDRNILEKPGSKRLSKETDPSHLNQHGKRTDIEILEMEDGSHKSPFAKKRKESKLNVARRAIKGKHEMETDTSEQTNGRDYVRFPLDGQSVSPPPETSDHQEMDLD